MKKTVEQEKRSFFNLFFKRSKPKSLNSYQILDTMFTVGGSDELIERTSDGRRFRLYRQGAGFIRGEEIP